MSDPTQRQVLSTRKVVFLVIAAAAPMGAMVGNVPLALARTNGIGLVGFLGYRSAELSAKVLGVLMVLEFAILIIFNFAVLGTKGTTALWNRTLVSREPACNRVFYNIYSDRIRR